MLTGSLPARLVKDMADALRNRLMPGVAGYFSGAYRGPRGADGIRAAADEHSGADVALSGWPKRTMDSSGQSGQGDGEQPGPGLLADRRTRHRNRENNPLIVVDELERILLSGVQAKWATLNFENTPRRHFEAWARSSTKRRLPPLTPESGLNCWEMLLWAAARRKVISHAELHRIYAPLPVIVRGTRYPSEWVGGMVKELLPHGRQRYIPDDPQPQRGDVIMWGDGAHVVMASGRKGPDGSPEVYSFWTWPKYATDSTSVSRATLTDAVQRTTIDELTPFVGNDLEIWSGRGPW